VETVTVAQERFTVEEVASELHISTKTLRRYLHQGRIKAYKIGGQYYFTPQQIQSFINSTETTYGQEITDATK
jgi:excisionase family DNA binding protein